jgi:Lrp/AsnC family transcriptional regulator for asnA, asnC and gidA
MEGNQGENYQFDNLDKQILNILIKDATVPFTDIAKELVVSGGTIHVRIKKLKELGVIKGAHYEVDPSKIGYDITAFMGIYLEKGSEYHDALSKFKKINEVVELHYTTGAYSMFAKIVCKDTIHLRTILNEKIQAIKGVQRTETFISLEQSIRREIVIK